MVKQRMDLLELLRKRGMDGDVDFLREALRVLVDGIMDAEVSAQIGAQHGERSPERVTYCPASTIFAGWRQSVLPVHLLGLVRYCVEGQVGGHQDGAPFVALAEDLEEQFRSGVGQGNEAQLVDDKELEAGQLPLQVEQPALVLWPP